MSSRASVSLAKSQTGRVSTQLDQPFAQRTAGLAAINEELRKEIAERKLTEERLRLNEEALREAHTQAARNEERWRSVFENSAIGVALTDLNGRFIATNPVYQKMLGYTGEELLKLSFFDITDEQYREANRELIRNLVTGKRRQFQLEKQYRRKDGKTVWVRNHVSIVPGTERVPRFLMAIVEDISDRKQAEDALRTSERKLRRVIDTIPTLAWCNLPDGPNEFLNKGWHEYTGLTPEKSHGWGWQCAIHPEDLPSLMQKWREMLVSGQPGEVEARLRRYDGVYRWFLIRAQPLRDEDGEVVRWYGTATDIDDRKRAEEQLRRSEAFLAEGQHLARIGNFSWRVVTDELLWSEQLYRIFQFEQGTPITLELIRTRVHPEDIAMLNDMIEQARKGVSDFEYEHRLLMPDSSVKYLHLIAHGIRDNERRLEYIGAVQDVTQRRSSEEALSKARSELTQVARYMTLGILTASIAHEVNQPLSGIVTNASTCLRMLSANPPNVDGARETARRTIRDGSRASDVITRLRALFSKKEASIEAVDLNDAAQEVIAVSLTDLQRNQVVLRSELASGLPPVTGDRVQLQQVILNLLRNASEAMNTVEDRRRELLITTEHDGRDQVRLSVKDAGTGFDPEAADRLFEAFYTTKNSGMGVGLSVCRSIIEKHHGRLWATLNDGPGATFSVSVPCWTDTKVQ
ncbi:MAG TPA: PAS domain S-box protein [Candidatus Angelobacter sp.]|nr:PAS domain S-box protein [Candidatus Angelobacter sp.]